MTSYGMVEEKLDSHGVSPAVVANAIQVSPSSPNGATQQKHLENLRTFQDLVGIRTPSHILSTGTVPSSELLDLEKTSQVQVEHGPRDIHYSKGRPKRSLRDLIYRPTISNDGIYGRAIDEELKARIGYNLSNWFINALYIVQIFVAATITGLASYRGHEVPLTVLGAVNAVLAGLMALLKGQGLPVRLKRSRDQFQNVMKSIENTERKFARYAHMAAGDQKLLNPFKEFQFLEDLFDAAKRDQQANYPDLYSNTHERAAVQALNENNRVGGLFGDITPEAIQAQNASLKAQIEELTARFNDAVKTNATVQSSAKSA